MSSGNCWTFESEITSRTFIFYTYVRDRRERTRAVVVLFHEQDGLVRHVHFVEGPAFPRRERGLLGLLDVESRNNQERGRFRVYQ